MVETFTIEIFLKMAHFSASRINILKKAKKNPENWSQLGQFFFPVMDIKNQ